MCGILGVVTGAERVAGLVPSLQDALLSLKHRGPDDHDLVRLPQGILGHTRLSIVGIDRGRQPMKSPDGRFTITFNGEIYNYRDLARTLTEKGHRFRTGGDTEVVLAAYQEYGARCVESFRGMFAFAIYDAVTGELFAARDRFGMKPFYYAHREGSFVFASESRALYRTGLVPFGLREDLLDEFLIFGYVAGGQTLHTHIRKLEPAHTLHLKDGALTTRRYWYPFPEHPSERPESEVIPALERAIEDAVRTWAPEDVKTPVFSLLSGGTDSSLITQLLREGGVDLTAVTAWFPDDPQMDERPLTRMMPDQERLRRLDVPIRDDYILGNLERLIGQFDEPVHDPNAFTLMALCEAIKERQPEVKIVFCGEGSDELFGGYARHRSIPEEYRQKPDPDILLFALNRVALPRLKLFTDRVYRPSPDRERILRELKSSDPVNKVLEQDQLTFLSAYLHRQDQVGMLHGLEFRAPFLDHLLAEAVNALPAPLKVGAEWSKEILRKVAARRLPSSIVWNRRKYQFAAPVSRMLREKPLRPLFERLFAGDCRLSRHYSPEGILALFRKHDPATPGQDHSNTLWRLLSLELWLRSWE